MENGDNGEDFTIASCINVDLVKEILSEDLNIDIFVTGFNAKKALPKGENYLSILYRVEVEYKKNMDSDDVEKYYMMIKVLPEGEVMQKFLSELRGFEKELYMYTNILPAMYRIIKSAKGKLHPLSARCLPCSKTDVIVMEDLKYLGYEMAMRKQGLDLGHCKLTVRVLARFHAASIALYKNDPSIKDIYIDGLYRDDDFPRNQFKDSTTALASVVESWPGYETFGEKLRSLAMSGYDKIIEIVKPKKNSFNVLNHGDCWTNNMLFRYNDETGKVEDMRFVDFQIARYTSPAIDLQYFMCNCPNDEVRFQHRHTLLSEYYTELAEYCKAMNIDSELISFQQLKEEFEEKNFFGLITASSILFGILANEEDVPEMKDVKEEEVYDQTVLFVRNAASRKRFRDIYQKLLVFYDSKGLL